VFKNIVLIFLGIILGVLICAVFARLPTMVTLFEVPTSAKLVQVLNPQSLAIEVPPLLPLPTTSAQQPKDCDVDANDEAVGSLPILQIDDLIFRILPNNGFDNLDWSYLSDQKYLLWKTSGINYSDAGWSCRQALARVEINGVQSKILLQSWTELAWTVSLYSSGNVKFGPQWIQINPGGTDSATTCFGEGFDGCSFDPAKILNSSLFKIVAVCDASQPGNVIKVYSISASNKAPDLIVYNENYGSGGASDLFEIRPLSYAAEICKS
jgi:hypothetical protein